MGKKDKFRLKSWKPLISDTLASKPVSRQSSAGRVTHDFVICTSKNNLKSKSLRNEPCPYEEILDPLPPITKDLENCFQDLMKLAHSNTRRKSRKRTSFDFEKAFKINSFTGFKAFYCRFLKNVSQGQISVKLAEVWRNYEYCEVWENFICQYSRYKRTVSFIDWFMSLQYSCNVSNLNISDTEYQLSRASFFNSGEDLNYFSPESLLSFPAGLSEQNSLSIPNSPHDFSSEQDSGTISKSVLNDSDIFVNFNFSMEQTSNREQEEIFGSDLFQIDEEFFCNSKDFHHFDGTTDNELFLTDLNFMDQGEYDEIHVPTSIGSPSCFRGLVQPGLYPFDSSWTGNF